MKKKFLEEDQKLLETVVAERMGKNSDEILAMRQMFDTMTAKAQWIHDLHPGADTTLNKFSKELVDFLEIIGKSYVQQWCLAEESLAVIAHLEAEIKKAGLDVEAIRKKYVEENQ
jgi:hypothetical protein